MKFRLPWKPIYIGGKENPYLVRWVLLSTRWGGVMLHKICRSDYDRALHDHPWAFWSLILKNGYREEYWNPLTEKQSFMTHSQGNLLKRPATWRHRVIIDDPSRPAWTLVFKGPRIRRWGFWVPTTLMPFDFFWCWWRNYDMDKGICTDQILNTYGED